MQSLGLRRYCDYPNKTIQSGYRSAGFPPFPLIPLMAYHRTVIKDVYVRYSILAISVRMFPPHPLIPLMAYYRTLIKYVHVLYLSY